MKEVICVDSAFSADQLNYWKSTGVVHPDVDKMYTIRDVTRHSTGGVGVRLEEVVNPKIKIKHSVLNEIYLEPSWKIERFRTLQGESLTKEMLNEIKEKV